MSRKEKILKILGCRLFVRNAGKRGKMNTLKYYEDNVERIFNAVENPKWRIWKVIDEDGITYQSKFSICNPKKLLKFIQLCKNPQKLYVSISEFLNPTRNHGDMFNQKVYVKEIDRYFYPRAGYLYDQSILLDSYFFIDLDSENDLRIAQQDAKKILVKLKRYPNLKLHSIQFSGKKGIHLIYKNSYALPTDIKGRLIYEKLLKKAIAETIFKMNLKTIDETHMDIMQDLYRVYAAPYSIKGDGSIVQPIDYNLFIKKDIYTLIHQRKAIEGMNRQKNRHSKSAKPNDNKVASDANLNLASQPYSVEQRDGLSSQPFYFKFVDNMVPGIRNNYVLVIKKHINRFKVEELARIQKEYNLSDFYVYELGNYVYALNLKCMQFARMLKILRRVKSQNLRYFMTRKHVPIPLSDIYSEGKVIHPLVFSGIMPWYSASPLSRPHSAFCGNRYGNQIGSSDNFKDIPCFVGTMMVS